MWPLRKRDMIVRDGTLVLAPRGSQAVDGVFELLKTTLPLIRTHFEDNAHKLKQDYDNWEDALDDLCISFSIACVWDAARRYYGQDRGSLFVDAMFHRIYSRYPKLNEPFHRYVEVPTRAFRVTRFVEDVAGTLDAALVMQIRPLATYLAADCLDILRASEPRKTGETLASSFVSRLNAYWDRVAAGMKGIESDR